MISEKYRCPKCGAMEVVLENVSGNPFGDKSAKLLCKKCGSKYDVDFGKMVINEKNVNVFPSQKDLEVDDPLIKKIKSKRGENL